MCWTRDKEKSTKGKQKTAGRIVLILPAVFFWSGKAGFFSADSPEIVRGIPAGWREAFCP